MAAHRKDVYAEKLKMIPLSEEGGYFVETYRSPPRSAVTPVPEREGKTRDLLTVIYYMMSDDLGGTNYWNRNKSDITHFFHDGWPVKYTTISPEGTLQEYIIGLDVSAGQVPQLTVPAGLLKAARVMKQEAGYAKFPGEVPFTLISEAVAPGFDYRDRYVPSRAELKAAYPDLWPRIKDLAPPEE